MFWLKTFFLRLRALVRPDEVERELDEELRFHIEMRTEELLRSGMTPDQARRAALRRFGNLAHIKDMSRDLRGGGMMETLLQDVRYGFRMLLKNRAFTAVAVAALAIGIGANTAIFSVVNSALLKPLPYKDPDSVMIVFGTNRMFRQASISPADFVQWRAQNHVFEDMAAYTGSPYNLTGGDQPVRVHGITVTAEFFPVLGVEPVLGRALLAEENQPGRNKVAVLSYALWQRSFDRDPQVIGNTIKLDGESFTVVGVMPREFQFTQKAEVITPLAIDPNYRANAFLRVIARIKPGVTREQAKAEMQTIADRLRSEQERRDDDWQLGTDIVSLHEMTVENSRLALLMLAGAVGFVLLIACANLANLLLARATARHKEMAVRAALGASRLRLIRQMLTESLLLGLMGGGAGLLLAVWGIEALAAQMPPSVPRINAIGIDGRVLAFTLLVSLVTSLLFGLVPAVQASKLELTEALKEGSRAARSAVGRFSFRSILVVGQVALATVLLAGAGLMINSLVRLLRVDMGFAPENVVTLNIALPEAYRSTEQVTGFYEQSLERIGRLPGVVAAGAVNQLPLGEMMLQGDFRIEGRPPLASDALAVKPAVTTDYFRALGIPLQSGRYFNERDQAGSTRVVVVSDSFRRSFFADEDAIGKRISFDEDQSGRPIWLEIVGVVGDVKQQALSSEPKPTVYAPYTQVSRLFMLRYITFAVRTTGDPARLATAIRGEIQAVDKDLPVFRVRTMQEVVSESVTEQRVNALLLGLFAALALLLAAVGIYGVMSYVVAQRTHEIGIRMALGAQRRDVLKIILGQGAALTLIGVGLGLAAGFAVTRLISSLLYKVSATDPLTFAVVSVVLTGVALGACFAPALRATRVDPMIALRYE